MKHDSRAFRRLLMAAAALVLLGAQAFADPFQNVLIITIDTLRADYVGCYGSKKVSTPNIDALAAAGVLFQNTVAPDPHTLPSHASILTGLLPPNHGLQDNSGFILNPKITTLAEIFKAQGMQTAAFVAAFPLDSRWGLNQGFDVYDDSYPTMSSFSSFVLPERKAEEVVDAALKWMGAHTFTRWFVWVHLFDPHFPYNPPERWRKAYPGDAYAGEIAYADEQAGRLFSFLKQKQLDLKTLTVLLSDHGESLGEHQEESHGIFAYESTLRVPFLIAPLPHKAVATRVRIIDVAPTVLELQGLPVPKGLDGASLAGALNPGTKQEPPLRDSYFQALSMFLNEGWAPLRGFYSQNFKFIDLPVRELYNISKDPHEKTNLCGDSKLCDSWEKRFRAFAKPYLTGSAAAAPAPMDRETLEQLRALGYVTGGAPQTLRKAGPQDDPKTLIPFHNQDAEALGFFQRGNHGKALQILQNVIGRKPTFARAYMDTAFIQREIGEPENAVATLRTAIAKGVRKAEVYSKLALYLFEAGHFKEAIEQAKNAARTSPSDIDNLNYLGMAYTAAGEYEEASATFKKALAVDPSDAMTISNLGTLYLTQKKFEAASREFEAAIAANPTMDGAYNGLGVIHASNKRWPEAIKYWSLAVQYNKKNFDAMLNLAYAYLNQNQIDKARPVLEEFVTGAPAARYKDEISKVRNILSQLPPQ